MQWSLEKIYREQVNGNIPPRKHLKGYRRGYDVRS